MKFQILIGLIFLPFLSIAQYDLEGMWDGIIITNGSQNAHFYEWNFTTSKVTINMLKYDEKIERGTLDYQLAGNQLSLIIGTDTTLFEIKEVKFDQLMLKENGLGNTVILSKKGTTNNIPFNELAYKTFMFENESPLYKDYRWIFTKVGKKYDLLVVNEGKLVGIFQLGSSGKLKTNLPIMRMRNRDGNFNFIFTNYKDNAILGFLDGEIPFKLIVDTQKPILDESQLIKNTIIQSKDSLNLYVLNIEKKQLRIKKNSISLQADGKGIYRYWEDELYQDNINWYLTQDGRFLFITTWEEVIPVEDTAEVTNELLLYIYSIQKENSKTWTFEKYQVFDYGIRTRW